MRELRGKPVAESICAQVRENVDALRGRDVRVTLGIVRVGDREDDLAYQRGATKRCESVGIRVEACSIPADITEAAFLATFAEFANRKDIHGVLLLQPLPKSINMSAVKAVFPKEKDVDCMVDENVASTFLGNRNIAPPCTAQAVIELLKYYNIAIAGANVVICGRSMVVGKPLSQLLLNENATVTVAHSRTENMADITRRADIVVSTIGKARILTAEYFSHNQVIIDVGINSDGAGGICGDVDYDAVCNNAAAITPVPGGVGAVTTAVLMQNTVLCAMKAVK